MKRLRMLLAVSLGLSSTLAAAEFDAAAAINQVGLDLFRDLGAKTPGTNLVISPYSIESALALAYAGADGKTRSEMAKALQLPLDDAALSHAIAALRAALATISAESAKISVSRRHPSQVHAIIDGKRLELQEEPEPTAAIEWHEANRLFAQTGYPFRDSFLALMRNDYAAPLEPLDFRKTTEKSRDTINRWVEEQTREKIRNLIPSGGVNAATRLVLVNALYLKAPWDTPFEKAFTVPLPFHPPDGSTREVQTMRRGDYMGYAHENKLTVVSLDYLGRELRCLILLPDKNRSLDAAASALTPADFARWTKLGDQTHSARITLYLPRFRIEGANVPLGPALRRLGLKTAFDDTVGSANFDRISARQPDDYLKLSEVFHQTFIALDEEGTEAAAATAVVMSLGAMADPKKPIEVRVDRPFLFAIQHRVSGACLFLGRITDPR